MLWKHVCSRIIKYSDCFKLINFTLDYASVKWRKTHVWRKFWSIQFEKHSREKIQYKRIIFRIDFIVTEVDINFSRVKMDMWFPEFQIGWKQLEDVTRFTNRKMTKVWSFHLFLRWYDFCSRSCYSYTWMSWYSWTEQRWDVLRSSFHGGQSTYKVIIISRCTLTYDIIVKFQKLS